MSNDLAEAKKENAKMAATIQKLKDMMEHMSSSLSKQGQETTGQSNEVQDPRILNASQEVKLNWICIRCLNKW